MKTMRIAILASIVASTPALAENEDWWLVSGEPGDTSVQFIDAASVNRDRSSVSFGVATYWSNGRSMERNLTMDCDKKPVAESYRDLWQFACGSEEIRLRTALKLGSQEPGWLAKTIFSMSS